MSQQIVMHVKFAAATAFVHTLRLEQDATAQTAVAKLNTRIRLHPEAMARFGLIAIYHSMNDDDSGSSSKLRTLAATDRIADYAASDTQWIYKDSATAPLDEDVSGDEAEFTHTYNTTSRDHQDSEVPWSSLMRVARGDLADELLVRSETDPNLWLRRSCILSVSAHVVWLGLFVYICVCTHIHI